MRTVFWYNFVHNCIVLRAIFTISQGWWLVFRGYLYNIYVVLIKKFHKHLLVSYNISIFSIIMQSFVMQHLFVKKRFYCLPKGSIRHYSTFSFFFGKLPFGFSSEWISFGFGFFVSCKILPWVSLYVSAFNLRLRF